MQQDSILWTIIILLAIIVLILSWMLKISYKDLHESEKENWQITK